MQTFFRPAVVTQPTSPLGIDWSNPITQGLIFSAYNATEDWVAGPWDYVTRTRPRSNSGVSWGASAGLGITPLFDGAASAAVALPRMAGIKKFTMSFWLWWNAYSNGSGKFAFNYRTDAGAQAPGTWFVLPDDSSGLFAISYASGASAQMAAKFTRPSAGAWHFYDWTCDTNQALTCITSIFADGAAQSLSGVNTYAGPSPVTGNAMTVMCTPAGTPTLFSAGRVANVNIWNRILTVTERRSMYRNALQVLASDFMLVGVPGGAAPSVSTSRWFLGA